MKCWHCETELIWGGDHDIEDNNDYSMVTFVNNINIQNDLILSL